MHTSWMCAKEPSLAEVIADPIVRLVMRRDRIGPEEVLEAVDRASRGLARRVPDLIGPKIRPTDLS